MALYPSINAGCISPIPTPIQKLSLITVIVPWYFATRAFKAVKFSPEKSVYTISSLICTDLNFSTKKEEKPITGKATNANKNNFACMDFIKNRKHTTTIIKLKNMTKELSSIKTTKKYRIIITDCTFENERSFL